ncbi:MULTISPECIES: 50S ribosomal protein L15 [Rhodomicrobium]|uniref:50S ribosomal protein L15 n=1 Tax=Rhodomicrobium TaxID=1068 RepID=UPI000B4B2D6F|nr:MULTISPECIES: 50S ribosomal protein L15 [Rhodomicrobium]
MQLNELRDNEGATQARKRVGRGIGSGLGKTAGRGHKGQKARSGVAIKGFEGGQMPIHMRMPKRGFNNPLRLKFSEVNLERIQLAIDEGKLDAKSPITGEALVAAGVVRRVRDGVRLLGRGALKAKVQIEVAGATASAVKAVEAAGGSIKLLKLVKDTDATERRPKKKAAPAKGE